MRKNSAIELSNREAMTLHIQEKIVVLLIDDDEEILPLVAKQLLPLNGVEIYYFKSGEEAMNFPYILQLATLVILDIRLKGEDGFNVDRLMQYSRTLRLPTIYVSSNQGYSEAVRRINDSDKLFVAKPFLGNQLLSKILELMRDSIWLKGLVGNLRCE
jgi:FixJ family two-component response regulator